ncbi:MAG: hypothetical protein NUW22_02010 [Acidobacteria bacterium]|nr:hypothetical protein [Acidobacteriota bacterium]
MAAVRDSVLAINAGSSSVKFAVYQAATPTRLSLSGRASTGFLIDWLEAQETFAAVKVVGHRVVQCGRSRSPRRKKA